MPLIEYINLDLSHPGALVDGPPLISVPGVFVDTTRGVLSLAEGTMVSVDRGLVAVAPAVMEGTERGLYDDHHVMERTERG